MNAEKLNALAENGYAPHELLRLALEYRLQVKVTAGGGVECTGWVAEIMGQLVQMSSVRECDDLFWTPFWGPEITKVEAV